MNKCFEGKTVLVTGAAGGIGRAIASAAASEGARIILADLNAECLSESAEQAKARGADVLTVECDICDQAQLVGLVCRAREAFGGIDVAYANAGIEGVPANVWDYPEAVFARVMEVNVLGTWRTIKSVLPEMLARGSGNIVATASVGGLVGVPVLSAYVASKHAVIGLVKSAALNVASNGIRVNAICPAMVDTSMLDRLADAQPGLREGLTSLSPVGRVATAEEVAGAAIWLGSDRSSFVTGHSLVIDGAFSAQ